MNSKNPRPRPAARTGEECFDNSSDQQAIGAYKAALGKTIHSVRVIDYEALRLTFTDGTAIEFLDEHQCCERRCMVVCDDPLTAYEGATVLYAEVADGPIVYDPMDRYSADCIQFLRVYTSQGVIVVSNHNDGRYWSFNVHVRNVAIEPVPGQS